MRNQQLTSEWIVTKECHRNYRKNTYTLSSVVGFLGSWLYDLLTGTAVIDDILWCAIDLGIFYTLSLRQDGWID